MEIRKSYLRLKNDRGRRERVWQQAANYTSVIPEKITSMKDDGDLILSKNTIDNTAINALNMMVAGLQSGITPATTKWFKLDAKTASGFIPKSMSTFEEILEKIIATSNVYSTLPAMYRDLCVYGCSMLMIEEHDKDVIALRRVRPAEYTVSFDRFQDPKEIYRELILSEKEAYNIFEQKDFSQQRDGRKVHIYNKIVKKDSVYLSEYEYDGDIIRTDSFAFNPCLFVRWDYPDASGYSASPVFNALGDIKQLQHQQYRKAQAIDYQVDPPVQIPISMRNAEISLRPGGVSYYSSDNEVIRPSSVVNYQINYLLQDMQEVRERIKSAMHYDAFFAISSIAHTGMTATEIMERKAEKITMIGSIIDRIQDEFIEPFVFSLVGILVDMKKTGRISNLDIPEEIMNADFEIVPTGSLYQTRLETSNVTINRYVSQISVLAQINPEIIRRIDFNYLVDKIAKNSGVDLNVLKSQEDVEEEIRNEQEAQLQQQIVQRVADVQAENIVNPLQQIGAYGNEA